MRVLNVVALLLCATCIYAQTCGRPTRTPASGNYDDEDRIVGGKVANAHSWPWQVSLLVGGRHNCGGSIINNQWILTAAHCLFGRGVYSINNKIGDHSLSGTDRGEQVISSSKFVIHPSYSQFSTAYDIALIKLSRTIQFTDTVQPVCLPTSGQELATGSMTYVTGWGSTGVASGSDKLKQAAVPVVDWNQCRRMHTLPVSTNTICTGYTTGGHNPCFGDSGGPLVVNNGAVWTLHGVVSWGPRTCAIKEEPAVFTKVSSYMSWIQQAIARG